MIQRWAEVFKLKIEVQVRNFLCILSYLVIDDGTIRLRTPAVSETFDGVLDMLMMYIGIPIQFEANLVRIQQ